MPQADGKNKLHRMEFEFKGQFYPLPLNPESFEQTEGTRSTVTQTKGGAYIDDFGAGLPTIYMKGSTGFANGAGAQKFIDFRSLIRSYYNAHTPGQKITDELIFHNLTDGESWVVHMDPNTGFKLYRSTSNPLMFYYEMYMICLRKADMPSNANSSEVVRGNPFGSALPLSATVPNLPTTPLYAYSLPFVQQATQADSKGNVNQSLATFVQKTDILSNGAVSAAMTTTSQPSASAINTNPTLSPSVSSLSLAMYNNLGKGLLTTVSTAPDQTSLLYKLTNMINVSIPNDVMSMLQACILEVAAINAALITSPSTISNLLSQEDVMKLAQNIRWVTYQLAGVSNLDITIIEDLRNLERAVTYVFRTTSLFSASASQILSDYASATGGTV